MDEESSVWGCLSLGLAWEPSALRQDELQQQQLVSMEDIVGEGREVSDVVYSQFIQSLAAVFLV